MAAKDLSAFGYRRIVLLLLGLLIVPTALLIAIGVVLLFLGEVSDIVSGVLVLALSGVMATGAILVWVFVRREANLSALQSDFVSKVSHELRTPLTSIRLFTETLQLRRGDPAAEDQCIDGLAKESRRLQELIDRLLDWGRMESGRREYQIVDTDVAGIVEGAVKAVEGAVDATTIDIDLPDDLPAVAADGAAVKDALVNLLTNASKYGGDPPKIGLRADADDRLVRISVSDNGAGIDPAEHKRIFQKFYRVDDRLSREREGSGLGLAIVHHVMKAHRGFVEVESDPGAGSTFTLALPRADG